MKTPIYKVEIELAGRGRKWVHNFTSRPRGDDAVRAIALERHQKVGRLTEAGHSSDEVQALYEDYIMLVRHFWPNLPPDDSCRCTVCGTYIGEIRLTKVCVATIPER